MGLSPGGGPAAGRRTAAGDLARLLACVVARELSDGEMVAFGLHAELLLAAALLAQRLHAPNLTIRHGLRVERGHELSPAAWTEEPTSRSHELVEYREAHDAILDVASRSSPMRFCDVFFRRLDNIFDLRIDDAANDEIPSALVGKLAVREKDRQHL